MKKKFLALVLTLAMVLSLVPVTALAADTPAGGASRENTSDNLTMKKTVTPNEDGTYTVRLESYATGSVTPTQAPVPMDFVLVLDVSGSMDGEKGQIASYGYQPTKQTSWSARDIYYAYYARTTYYAQIGDEYYPVSYQSKWVPDGYFSGHTEYWLEANGQPLGKTGGWNDKLYSGSLYTYGEVPGSKMSKLKAMQTAVNSFIDSVAAQKNGETPVAHRISIVKFAGDSKDEIGNHTYTEYGYTYNHTQEVKELTDVTAEGSVDSLKRAVNALKAGGATQADLGMEKADGVLNGRQDAEKDRPSVVIMFTDGEPTTSNDFEWKVAGAAVDTAKTLKAGGTKVYTIGMFEGADPEDIDGAFNKYMNGVSSKYPDAVGTKKNNKKDYNGIYLGTRAEGNYYFKADNAGALDQVFQTISQSTTVTSPLDASAVVVDNVPSNFALNKGSVQVYTTDCTGKNSEGELTWKDTLEESNIIPNIPEDKNEDGSQTISTTGFDFSQNWCGVKADNTTPTGKKLIIEFTISRTNYGGTQPTNAGAYIKAGKEANEAPIISLKDPEVPVTVQLPEGSDPYTDTKVYNGAGFDIKDEIGKIVAGLVPVNRINNKFIDLTYEIKDNEGTPVGTYTIPAGETTGMWSADSTEIKTGSNVGNYTYKITVIGQDKKQSSNKNSKECTATFAITQRDATFTGESKSVTWNGKNQTITGITAPTDLVSGHTYDGGLTYVAQGIDTGTYVGKFTGTAIIKDATGKDVTANYNVKTELGKLIITEKEEVSYTVIFDPNGGAWSDTTFNGYTVSEGKASRSGVPGTEKITSTSITAPTNQGKVLDGWGYYDNETLTKISNLDLPSQFAPTVEQLYNEYGQKPTNTVTLYAIWKDDTTPDGPLTYTINQHYMRNAEDADHVEIKDLTSEQETQISTLIAGKDTNLDWRDAHGSTAHYIYDGQKTTVTVPGLSAQPYNANDTLDVTGTVIDLYYYLDNWKDGDTKNPSEDDSKTDGDGIPDYKQILIEYKAHTPLVGEVSREFEIQTLTDNQKVATPTGATAKAKENAAYAFAYWIKGEVDPKKTEAEIENTAICYEKKLSGVTIDPVTGGRTYTYTAIFLEDKIGGGDNKDQPDGIPDAWQYKVTFKVVNGKWNNQTTADVVAYVTNKKNDTPCAKGTEGSKATLDGVTIPVAGSQPDSGYRASGNWDTTPSATTVINKEDTVFTYTYDQKSGGSGGSGGSHKPTVTIPDDVPTGLNGKDHYAYVVGYPDGMVYPQKNITRAEVATIFFRLLEDETREANMTKSNSYNDMKDGAWYTCAVSTLSKMGIIKGYEDGSFKPDASISRAEFAAIAARFDPDGDKTPATFSDVSSHWAKDEISIAANHGWIKGYEDGSFKPDQKITRAETMTLVNRVLKRLPETKDDLHKDMKTWPDNQKESAWFYLAVQEATNSHYQKLKKDGTHETWESMRETRDWAALEK